MTLGLFDLDNTLIDRRAMFARWASGMLERLGIGEADDVAHAAVYLLSPESRWVTGSTLVVDGGYTAR